MPSASRNQKRAAADGEAPRKRWKPAPAQKSFLEAFFLICDLPNRVTVDALSRTLNIDPRQVRIWFQNRRQRLRKEHTDDGEPKAKNDARESGHPFSATFSSTPGIEPFLLGHMTAAWAIVTGTPAEALKGEKTPAPVTTVDFRSFLSQIPAIDRQPTPTTSASEGSHGAPSEAPTSPASTADLLSPASDAAQAAFAAMPSVDSFHQKLQPMGIHYPNLPSSWADLIPAPASAPAPAQAPAPAPQAPAGLEDILAQDPFFLDNISVEEMCQALDL